MATIENLSPQLHFEMTSEEDVMEWTQFEPPICKEISALTEKRKMNK
jgi:hypothetical protein